jgi:hypothetical protein
MTTIGTLFSVAALFVIGVRPEQALAFVRPGPGNRTA